jgi:hypothetical protein
LGELGEARRVQEQMVAARLRISGAEHPATLTAQGSLAVILADMGELGEARRVQEQVVGVMTRVLGAEHPTTLTAQRSLTALSAAQRGGFLRRLFRQRSRGQRG